MHKIKEKDICLVMISWILEELPHLCLTVITTVVEDGNGLALCTFAFAHLVVCFSGKFKPEYRNVTNICLLDDSDSVLCGPMCRGESPRNTPV